MKLFTKSIVRAALAAAALFTGANALAVQFVSNGGFENLTNGANHGTLYTDAVDWTVTSPGGTYGGKGYSMFWDIAGVDGTGANDNNGPGSPIVNLWGPGHDTMFNNGLSASPTGGNFFGSDSDNAYAAAISQTVSGLTVGQTYRLTFDWAGAQLFYLNGAGFYGDNWHSWVVSLGGQTQQTVTLQNQERHFTGWRSEVMHFTATSATETLSFLSQGGPGGAPPIALLDSVSLTVPEPASWGLMLVGFGAMGFAARRRRSISVTA